MTFNFNFDFKSNTSLLNGFVDVIQTQCKKTYKNNNNFECF